MAKPIPELTFSRQEVQKSFHLVSTALQSAHSSAASRREFLGCFEVQLRELLGSSGLPSSIRTEISLAFSLV